MAWIKKNLVFVISAAAALVLLGVAVWLWLSNMSRDTAIQEELNQELANWQQLNAGAFPNDENIKAAKNEQERLRQFRKEAASVIPVASAAPKLSDQAFVNMLGNTIAGLRTKAEQSGVSLPEQFDFTFSAQRRSLNFPAGSIENWVPQLNDIEAICNILFAARVNALDSVQRVPVSPQDTGTGEFMGGTVVSNQFGIFAPYQVGFRGFSGELAAVLEAFQRATNFIVVKSVFVVPATGEFGSGGGGGAMPTPIYYAPRPQAQQRTVSPMEFDLAGGKDSGARRPVAQQPVYQQRPRTTTPGSVAETVLSEQPLQVTLLLEVVKLNRTQ
ncbi:MAG: hypothetical protein H0X66_09200 [Verrucomicrobia bacterium]|nr:hypothetical protein [Verrucomicrobiota bacterium]